MRIQLLVGFPVYSSRCPLTDPFLVGDPLHFERLSFIVKASFHGYVASQVIGKAYNRECDMWSIGVILFTLLCGYPPFWGDTEREIYGRVKRGHYAFEGPEWQVS